MQQQAAMSFATPIIQQQQYRSAAQQKIFNSAYYPILTKYDLTYVQHIYIQRATKYLTLHKNNITYGHSWLRKYLYVRSQICLNFHHHHPIIITKIFVRTFTNIPKLPTIIIPSSSPITIPEIVSGSGIKFTGHFQKKVTLCAHTCYCNGYKKMMIWMLQD